MACSADTPGTHWQHVQCVECPAPYLVCGGCHDNAIITAMTGVRPGTIDLVNISRRTPEPAGVGVIGIPHPAWTTAPGHPLNGVPWPTQITPNPLFLHPNGFQTRLCRDCQWQAHDRAISLQALVPAAPPADYHRWWNQPWNSCTCRYALGRGSLGGFGGIGGGIGIMGGVFAIGPRYCHNHRLQLWRQSCAHRHANDRWLRNTARTNDARTVRASTKTKKKRERNGTWRACRCGATIRPNDPVEVLLCMACGGTEHVVLPIIIATGAPNPLSFFSTIVRRGRRNAPSQAPGRAGLTVRGPMPLGRPWGEGTA